LTRIAHKQVFVQTFGWTASVAFTGVGSTLNLDVSRWLAEQVIDIGGNDTFHTLVDRRQGADAWLARLNERHTFAVAAFVGDRPKLVLVSNWESLNAPPNRTIKRRLEVSSRFPSNPRVVVTGAARTVTQAQRDRLRNLLRADAVNREVIQEGMAEVNRAAAGSVQGQAVISPECFTSYLWPDGRGGCQPHGIAAGTGWMPLQDVLLFKKLGLEIQPSVGPDGKVGAVQLTQTHAARFQPQGTVQSRIAAKPHLPLAASPSAVDPPTGKRAGTVAAMTNGPGTMTP
jgi:hypothetical protein